MSDNVNVLHFSPSGTTKSVADILSNRLGGSRVTEYDILRRPQKENIVFGAKELSLFVLPVYAGRIPSICADMLTKFEGRNTPAVAVVIYGNREYDDALIELADMLKANGFVVIAAAAFIAQHSVFPAVASGRPDSEDEEAISDFADKCREAFKNFTGNELISVKGNSSYCEPSAIPLKPSGDSKCNACGACVKICPTGAIEADEPQKTNEALCISCTACIAACPQKARNFHNPMYAAAGKAFAEAHALRKEPEIFLAEPAE